MADNLKIVYSPAGEKFEVTPANYRDLTRLAGWTDTPPHPDTVAANLAASETEEEDENTDNSDENVENNDENSDDENNNDENSDEDEDNDDDNNAAADLRTTEEAFADLADKEAVRAYIEEKFPGTELDGRWNREKLVAKAIELAA